MSASFAGGPTASWPLAVKEAVEPAIFRSPWVASGWPTHSFGSSTPFQVTLRLATKGGSVEGAVGCGPVGAGASACAARAAAEAPALAFALRVASAGVLALAGGAVLAADVVSAF